MSNLDEKTAVYWIWFSLLEQVSIEQKLDLLGRFGDIDSIFTAPAIKLRGVEWMTKPILDELQERELVPAYEAYKACKAKDIHLLPITDEQYPAALKNIPNPPVLLYYKGILPNFGAQPIIGVVGTRQATAYGNNMAQFFSRQIAACGGLVISGGAKGIDTMAIRGGLEAGKPVIIVVASGLDIVYPAENKRLFTKVAETGCIFSEYAPGTPALKYHFPQRNRIVSGIANGVLVVEAPEKSGALITARQAKKYGKDIFAVPANLDLEIAKGSNALLQENATAAYSGWDVIKKYETDYPGVIEKKDGLTVVCPLEFATATEERVVAGLKNPVSKRSVTPEADKKSIDNIPTNGYSGIETALEDCTPEEQEILKCLGKEPVLIDEIVAKLGKPAGKIMATLTMLVMQGKVEQHSGKRVSLR